MAEVRDARSADAEEIASVHVASWKAAYRGLLPDDYLDALAPGDRLAWWRQRLADGPPARGCILVVEDDGGVRGFSATVPDEEDPDASAVVPQIYLHPAVWGRGYGRALMEAMLERLRGAGFRQATLWVHPDNVRARRFYQAAGWVADGAEQVEVVWGVPVPEVRYRRAI